MRVLLTTCSLVASGGVEMHLLDLARGLLRRRCEAVVYAPKLGAFAARLRDLSVPVVDDLAHLHTTPDVVHGHYGPSLMAALLRYPTTPGVQTCHGWDWRGDVPPNLPRVLRRLAVDAVCRDRLVCGFGVPEEDVQVLFNGVDLARFAPRPKLPTTPRRAVVFSNYQTHRTVEPIVTACGRAGVAVDLVGRRFGADCVQPECLLSDYDLVFAKGRCAWEALATGCAVVVADTTGLGPLVTSAELPALRLCNFGKRLMVDPLTVELVGEQIARYDAADAACVSRQVRRENSLELLLDQLHSIYSEVIAEHQTAPAAAGGDDFLLAAYAERLCRELAVDEPRAVSRSRLIRKRIEARADRLVRQATRLVKSPWSGRGRRAA